MKRRLPQVGVWGHVPAIPLQDRAVGLLPVECVKDFTELVVVKTQG